AGAAARAAAGGAEAAAAEARDAASNRDAAEAGTVPDDDGQGGGSAEGDAGQGADGAEAGPVGQGRRRGDRRPDRGRGVSAPRLSGEHPAPDQPVLPLDRADRTRGGNLFRNPEGWYDRGHPARPRFRGCLFQFRGDGGHRAGGSAGRVRPAPGGFSKGPAARALLLPAGPLTGSDFT